jgi:hypothetical protein
VNGVYELHGRVPVGIVGGTYRVSSGFISFAGGGGRQEIRDPDPEHQLVFEIENDSAAFQSPLRDLKVG